MRRSRAPLTAWPAFADLMTILAVVSLAIAAIVSTNGDRTEPEPSIEELQRQLADANKKIEELKLVAKFPSGVPCLWNDDGVVPLLHISVASEYVVTRLRQPERDTEVAAIPRLADAIEQGQMDAEQFQEYARAIYQHGVGDDTFDRSCRFYVELGQGGTYLEFSRAVGTVNKYFLFSNSGEVNGILSGGE